MKLTEKAWCAGIIDGEGTITLVSNSATNITPRVMFTMTHLPTVNTFKQMVGDIGHTRTTNFTQSPNHKVKHHFQANGKDAVKLAKLLLPYLVTKKEHAKVIIEYCDKCMPGKGKNKITKSQQSIRSKLVKKIRFLNKKGP